MTEEPHYYDDPQLQASAVKMHHAEEERIHRIERAYEEAVSRFCKSEEYQLFRRLKTFLRIGDILLLAWIMLLVVLAIIVGAVVTGVMNVTRAEIIWMAVVAVLIIGPFLLWRMWARPKCKDNIQRIVFKWTQTHYPALMSEEGITISPAAIVDILMK